MLYQLALPGSMPALLVTLISSIYKNTVNKNTLEGPRESQEYLGGGVLILQVEVKVTPLIQFMLHTHTQIEQQYKQSTSGDQSQVINVGLRFLSSLHTKPTPVSIDPLCQCTYNMYTMESGGTASLNLYVFFFFYLDNTLDKQRLLTFVEVT